MKKRKILLIVFIILSIGLLADSKDVTNTVNIKKMTASIILKDKLFL